MRFMGREIRKLFSISYLVRGLLVGGATLSKLSLVDAQVDVGPDGAGILENSIKDENGVFWLQSGEYTAENTDRLNKGELTSPLLGGLGIQENTHFVAQGEGRYSVGLGINDGDIKQIGGEVISIGSKSGFGIDLAHGNYFLEDGFFHAIGQSGGTGINLKDGDFVQNGGHAVILGTSGSWGSYLWNGEYQLNGGLLESTGTGWAGMGSYLYHGDFVQNGGSLISSGIDGGTGLNVTNGDFIQNDGDIVSKGAAGSWGMFLWNGNFNQNGGSLFSSGDDYRGFGIHLNSGDFVQNAGLTHALGKNGGTGINLYEGSYFQNGGTTIAYGDQDSWGIYLWNGNYHHQDGELFSAGRNGGYGIYLDQGNFVNEGGFFRPGINLEAGNSDEPSIYVANGYAQINSDAELKPWLINSHQLNRGTSVSQIFLHAEQGIEGEYQRPEDTLTMSYEIQKINEDQDYEITATRKFFVSDFAKKVNNYNLAISIEDHMSDVPDDSGLANAYSQLDGIEDRGELNASLYSMLPNGAVKTGAAMRKRVEAGERKLEREIGNLKLSSTESPSGKEQWKWWAEPSGGFLSGRNSKGNLKSGEASFYFGKSKSNMNQKISLGGYYSYDHLDFGNSDVKSHTVGIAGMIRHYLSQSPSRSSFLEASFGAGLGVGKQSRETFLGERYKSDLMNHYVQLSGAYGWELTRSEKWKITPKIGLSYTYLGQNGYRERGDGGLGLLVNDGRQSILTGKIGITGEYQMNKKLKLFGESWFHYDLTDGKARFESSFKDHPQIGFATIDEEYKPYSLEVGIGGEYQLTKKSSLRLGYQLYLDGNRTSHGGKAEFIYRF